MPLDPKQTLKRIRIIEPQDERTAALKEFDSALLKLAEDTSPDNIEAAAKAEKKLIEVDAAYREGARLLLLRETAAHLLYLQDKEK